MSATTEHTAFETQTTMRALCRPRVKKRRLPVQAFGSLALSSPQQRNDARGSPAPHQVSQRSASSLAAATSSGGQAGGHGRQPAGAQWRLRVLLHERLHHRLRVTGDVNGSQAAVWWQANGAM